MDAWMNGWVDEWTDEWTDEWMNGQMNGGVDCGVDGLQCDGRTDALPGPRLGPGRISGCVALLL